MLAKYKGNHINSFGVLMPAGKQAQRKAQCVPQQTGVRDTLHGQTTITHGSLHKQKQIAPAQIHATHCTDKRHPYDSPHRQTTSGWQRST
eukprot:1158441-Pelagomonas_calceolata.AAC.4